MAQPAAARPPIPLTPSHVSLFDRFRAGQSAPAIPPAALLGCWRLVRADAHLDLGEHATLEFRQGNDLRCTFEEDGRPRVLKMAYWLEGNVLVTDQASAPREQRMRLHLETADLLRLDYGGALAWFERTDCVAPAG